jgi:hypothetical protein
VFQTKQALHTLVNFATTTALFVIDSQMDAFIRKIPNNGTLVLLEI